MCCSNPAFYISVYVLAVNLFGLYLRFVYFHNYFECFACRELDFKDQAYDYIVVGSGSAGSIVARRLAENPSVKVLLIEAGASGNGILQIPTVSLMLQDSVFDWQYRTVPQKHACLGLDKKVSHWPMGKILGGTAMLNNMIYVRGHPQDFAEWYKDSCNFNYTIDVLPYFKKLESNETNKHKCSVFVEDMPFKSNLSDYFLQAGLCLGFGLSDGVNSEPGFSATKVTMRNGQRWTPYHQLEKTKKRNLVVITNSLVEKVLLKSNYEAYGVKYTHLDETYYVRATKGVILSAGVIGSPKILMLSGIGPKKHLEKLKIAPRLDLPVGENLQDHVTTGLDLITLEAPPDMGLQQMLSPWSASRYFLWGEGPWTSPGCESVGFFNSEDEKIPELQFMILPYGAAIDGGSYLRGLVGIGERLWEGYFRRVNGSTMTVLPVVLHPKSRGTVRLKSKDPRTPPLIDPNYLAEGYDVDILLEGIELVKEFLETPPMRRLGAKLNAVKFPGCEGLEFDTRPYWVCYVRHFTLSSYHPVGTCALGRVIDEGFQVKGTNKLYVVDGSVLPSLPSGNPQGAIMMMAERAAEIIKHHCWLSQRRCCSSDVFQDQCSCY
ncbi:Glucose dehydrogenase [FAD, quinone]-like Protein [Tribolium castaneum]|uniref:Glucose dehydrogenase [FAD, quinone]-like Protein n=1 Tax=Tribolium castaneum TaxID=7070 RepID=D6WXF7_TRICA|nr:PREDICTED: alcohol dehydrogenase [acceptor] isoform X1 [Tribolium castaneum]EFA08835.1 Glucose dehydrogenase [FAD, quinone]-like Protein [Tribolium castaneum]|eukprot:XP_008196922.1 PREDICTED: alcohol dehydrogenase [acceptor] isoform X1 [Tribolium castaneum]